MWSAFPASDYYGPSAPPRGQQPTADLPTGTSSRRRRGQPQGGSHVHHVPVDGIDVQLSRCSLTTGTPQAFPDGLLTGINDRLRSRPPGEYRRARTAARPTSTRLEPVPLLSGFKRWFTLVTPLHLACRTRAVWRCLARPVVVRAASRPPLRFQGQAALSSSGLLRQPTGEVSHLARTHGASWRTFTAWNGSTTSVACPRWVLTPLA
jgi:hypothetical protein